MVRLIIAVVAALWAASSRVTIGTVPFRLTYRDAKGWLFQFRAYITQDFDLATANADIEVVAQTVRNAIRDLANDVGLTNAKFQSASLYMGELLRPITYGDNAEFPSAPADKAVYTFADSSGSFHRYRIGAPTVAQFESDGLTVNNQSGGGANAQVVAFVAAMKTGAGVAHGAFVSSRGGLALTNFIGGIRRVGKQPRRFNETIKSALLVAGEGE
jgi:hypothetical protein